MVVAAAPCSPRFEHRTDGTAVLGVGTGTPRLSWSVPKADEGYEQTAYEIEVQREGNRKRYRVDNREQVLVPWPAEPLGSRESAEVRIRVAHGEEWSGWGEPAVVEAGLLDVSEWRAGFVSPTGVGDLHAPAPVLSGSLELPGDMVKARLYATAHGLYVAALNGRRVGDHRWHRAGPPTSTGCATRRTTSPTWSTGDATLWSSCWATAGTGAGSASWRTALYGDRLALLAQLEVDHRRRPGARPRHATARGPRARARSSPTTSTTASTPTSRRRGTG